MSISPLDALYSDLWPLLRGFDIKNSASVIFFCRIIASTQTFILHVEAGAFTDSEIVVMLGENGTGKVCILLYDSDSS